MQYEPSESATEPDTSEARASSSPSDSRAGPQSSPGTREAIAPLSSTPNSPTDNGFAMCAYCGVNPVRRWNKHGYASVCCSEGCATERRRLRKLERRREDRRVAMLLKEMGK